MEIRKLIFTNISI